MGFKGLRLFDVRGIAVRVDASWLVIAALITWSFWGRYTSFYDRGGKVAVGMAVVGAALFFGSVLLHELAHALEAQRRGVHVGSITLFLFGGVTETSFEVDRPGDEFALTAVGPFTSFVLGATFGLVATTATDAGVDMVAEVAGQLGWINVALGAFNLLPGAPLDGGRILRAAVWKATGDRSRAVRVAAQVGRGVGFVLIGLGLVQLLSVPGAFVGGAWLAFIGWFLARAAQMELAQEEATRILGQIRTGRLVDRSAVLDEGATVSDAVEHWQTSEGPEVLGVRSGGTVVGIVAIDDVRAVPADRRDEVTLRSVMTPVDDLPSVPIDTSADALMDAMRPPGVAVVTEAGRPIGLVTAERLVHAARRRQQLEHPPVRSRTGVGGGR